MDRLRPLNRVIGKLLGTLALTGFALTLLLVLPAYFVVFACWSQRRAPHVAHTAISRNWAKLLFPLFFIRFKVIGKENIDPETTYVFIANHRSQLDIPAYALSCRNTFRFLAKKELTRIPGLGWIIKRLYITVDRSDPSGRAKSMEAMRRSLDEGISVFLCPEGTRNTTTEPVLPFKDGAFRLAIETKRPLAVLTVIDSDKRLSPLHPLTLLPGSLICKWEKPIVTSDMTIADVQSLKDRAREIMLKNLAADAGENNL